MGQQAGRGWWAEQSDADWRTTDHGHQNLSSMLVEA